MTLTPILFLWHLANRNAAAALMQTDAACLSQPFKSSRSCKPLTINPKIYVKGINLASTSSEVVFGTQVGKTTLQAMKM